MKKHLRATEDLLQRKELKIAAIEHVVARSHCAEGGESYRKKMRAESGNLSSSSSVSSYKSAEPPEHSTGDDRSNLEDQKTLTP